MSDVDGWVFGGGFPDGSGDGYRPGEEWLDGTGGDPISHAAGTGDLLGGGIGFGECDRYGGWEAGQGAGYGDLRGGHGAVADGGALDG